MSKLQFTRVVGAGNDLYCANMYGLAKRGEGVWAFACSPGGAATREWIRLPAPPVGTYEYVEDIYCHITGVFIDADGGPQTIVHELRALTNKGVVYCYNWQFSSWSEAS